VLAVYVTWPQGLYLYSTVTQHPDTFFSMWRLSWFAHALQTDPRHLFDGNIYYPELRTLAYSDATLLQGALGAPLLWVGAPPTLVYNLLFILGIAGSGVAMFALAHHLVGSARAALVAAAAFTLAPYRPLHFMHLELQWMMWIPLALLALHRTIEERSWRAAVLTGICLWLQVLSCVYYGIFLSVALAVVGTILLATNMRRAAGVLPLLVLAAVVAAVLTIPYAQPYVANAKALGERTLDEVYRFSASPLSYVTWPKTNRWFGWTAVRFQGEELRLAPGIVATVLALVSLFVQRRKTLWIYLALCVLTIELSFGMNGHLYPLVRAVAAPFRNLRAPARFSVIALCALAVLAAFGVEWLERRLAGHRRSHWLVAAIIAAMIIEMAPLPLPLTTVPLAQPPLYRYIAHSGPAVVADFPMPSPIDVQRFDPYYEFYSRHHWRPLINGYSGYYSNAHFKVVEAMVGFPDDVSMEQLRALNVRWVVIHEHLYKPSEFIDLLIRIAPRRDLRSHGAFGDWQGSAQLFELSR